MALNGKLAMQGLSSAFGGKADMAYCSANVRLWPKADIFQEFDASLATSAAICGVGTVPGAAWFSL